MSDFTPFLITQVEDEASPFVSTAFKMLGFPRLGIGMVQCKNCIISLEASNTGEDGEWRTIRGQDSTAGGVVSSVTFGASPANYNIYYVIPFKYGRISILFSDPDNYARVIASRSR